ncbi:hypothetical protein SAMN05443575_1430 [Jatrophihabitans endophyticus]|uniref:Uncharacterized protein n=1 Tax=Jatrophihabitans endophyticus TaxID=1206085 RepID=A0A1M5H863_9ACTN|nr:hypothetical protein SAMN05443575_1430 [Jatrophihabitans endophyticus]
MIVSHTGGGDSASPTMNRLHRVLDALPLPAGARQGGEEAHPEAAPATLQRSYSLPAATGTSEQVVSALRHAHYEPVDVLSGAADPEGWEAALDHRDTGMITVRPPENHGRGGIDLNWTAGFVFAEVDANAFPA